MIYKKYKSMQQVDNMKSEELPVSKDSANETITLKNNQQKLENNDKKISTNSDEEAEEIDNRTCFQKTCGKWAQVQCVDVFLIYAFFP